MKDNDMHKINMKLQGKRQRKGTAGFRARRCFLLLIMSIFLLEACQEVPVASQNNNQNITESPAPDMGMTETPTPEATAEPTPEATTRPTPQPTAEPIPEATAEPTPLPTIEPTVEPTPVLELPEATGKSLLGFLQIAIQPVGKTMYVWGGGWNEEDTAAGIEAVTLGVSPAWEAFAVQQDASYDYNKTRYQIHDGLDCSGYVGWAVYNVLETENGKEGYVLSSTKMAEDYAGRGLGEYLPVKTVSQWKPGDIVSMKGHVWIAVGMCGDGSVLLLHSSPPGVSFCGTTLADGSKSQAVALAERIMQNYYPEWYAKYPECARPHSYLTGAAAMRWSRDVLEDEEGLEFMSAEEVVSVLFEER